VGRDEVQAAYFALLRAREELDALRRYEEYLEAERTRLLRFVAHGDELEARVDPRLRRALVHTERPLADALRGRLGVVADELTHLPERLEAAEAYVADCERDHDTVRRTA
jgi:hypothetical protein